MASQRLMTMQYCIIMVNCSIDEMYGQLYGQLDQPPKGRFDINKVEVYGLL